MERQAEFSPDQQAGALADEAQGGGTAAEAGPLGLWELTIDPEVLAIGLPLAAAEADGLEEQLLRDGCRDSLVVWKAENVLLDGHNRYRFCRKHGIAFRLLHLEFPDRAAALRWVYELQAGRRNITPGGSSYLRGHRYLAAKQGHGGARRKGAKGQSDPLTAAEVVARETKVAPRTVKRDARFARAVDILASNGGKETKRLLLSRDARIGRHEVERWARLPVNEQRALLKALARGKRPPRSKRDGFTLWLPAEPRKLARTLMRKLKPEDAEEVCKALEELLAARTATDV